MTVLANDFLEAIMPAIPAGAKPADVIMALAALTASMIVSAFQPHDRGEALELVFSEMTEIVSALGAPSA